MSPVDVTIDAAAATFSIRFDPVEGRCRWAGRARSPVLVELLRGGRRDVRINGEPATLGEPDPWGRVRISGTGRPPWPAEPAG